MSNMSYCRFENTVSNLVDCRDHINDDSLSDDEERAKVRLLTICEDILDSVDMYE